MWNKKANNKNNKNDPCYCDFLFKDNKLQIPSPLTPNPKPVNTHSNKLKNPLTNNAVKTKSNNKLLSQQQHTEKNLPEKKSLKKIVTTISNSKFPESQKETLSHLTKSKKTNPVQQLSPRIQQMKEPPITNIRDNIRLPCMQPQHIIIANTTIIRNIIQNSEYYSGAKIHTKEMRPLIQPKTIDRQCSLKQINTKSAVADPLKRSGSHKQFLQSKKQKPENQTTNKKHNDAITINNNNNINKSPIQFVPERKTFQDLSLRSMVSSIESKPRLSAKQQSQQQSQVIEYLMERRTDELHEQDLVQS